MENPAIAPEESTAFPPDLERLGIVAGARIDIRDLNAMGRRHNVLVYLYFEGDLARDSTLEKDLKEYNGVPEPERPFVNLNAFLMFAAEQNPLFTRQLDELPLIIEIVACGNLRTKEGEQIPYIKGLMPFLDELTLEDDQTAS